jgi:hypothetical protein
MLSCHALILFPTGQKINLRSRKDIVIDAAQESSAFFGSV